MICGYNAYYASGLYDIRYPRPNPSTFSHINNILKCDSNNPNSLPILDLGAGSGRYSVPLLRALPDLKIVAVDPTISAQKILLERAMYEGVQDRLQICSDISECSNMVFSHALALFGVISHITVQSERLKLLRCILNLLDRGGSLICTVPNLYRRFPYHVVKNIINNRSFCNAGEISYVRHTKDKDMHLDYHLYLPSHIKKEFSSSGFKIVSMCAESFLPESVVVNSEIAAKVDTCVLRLIPAIVGYGIIVIATRNQV